MPGHTPRGHHLLQHRFIESQIRDQLLQPGVLALLRVPSPKTEHHEGQADRWLPMYPELVGPLAACRAAAHDPDGPVIARHRDPAANLRTRFLNNIQKAGL